NGKAMIRFSVLSVALWLPFVAVAIGCRQDMHEAPGYKAYARSVFFGDERSARPLVEGTVARGQLDEDELYYTGKKGGVFTTTLPLPLDAALLARGRPRYRIY